MSPGSPTRRHFTLLSMASIAAAGTILLGPARIGRAAPVATLRGTAFGTTWSVSLPDGRVAAELRSRIEATLAGIDADMSPWRADSAISLFNRAAAGRHPLPAETCSVIRAALAVARASDGAFDPTVGPIVHDAGFGPIKGSPVPGWQDVGAEITAASKARAGLTVDLCGIAKGHALDRMAEILRDAGEGDFIAELGGELLASGRHPSGRDWRAGIENPLPGISGVAATLALGNRALATSGLRWNGRGSGTGRVGHIVDPRLRRPASGALASVTVLHTTATRADAWSTALFAAGAQRAPALARREGISALLLTDAGGGLAATATGGLNAALHI